jgi:AbrB family looped-hinge helix DNA binding protein
MKMHGSVTVGSKWQIVIPSDVRKLLGIESGDTLFAISKHNKAIAFIKTEDIEEFMRYMQQEMDTIRLMAQNMSTHPLETIVDAELKFIGELQSAGKDHK